MFSLSGIFFLLIFAYLSLMQNSFLRIIFPDYYITKAVSFHFFTVPYCFLTAMYNILYIILFVYWMFLPLEFKLYESKEYVYRVQYCFSARSCIQCLINKYLLNEECKKNEIRLFDFYFKIIEKL